MYTLNPEGHQGKNVNNVDQQRDKVWTMENCFVAGKSPSHKDKGPQVTFMLRD